MRRASAWSWRVVTGAVLVAAACAEGVPADSLELAAVLSTTGPLAQVGRLQLEAVRLAVDEINAAGGVLGQPLSVVHLDDGSSAEHAGNAAAEVRARGIPVAIGAVASGPTRELARSLAPAAVIVSPSATAASLASVDVGGFLFRACASDEGQAKLLAQRARDRGFTRVAIIRPTAAAAEHHDATGLAEAFTAAFETRGGTVVAEVPYRDGAVSHLEVVSAVVSARPDAVLLDANPVDGASILQDYAVLHSSAGIFWYFTDKVEDETFVVAVGASSFGFPHEGTGPGTPGGTRFTRFQDAYRARTGGLPTGGSYTANAYDAVFLVALAAEAAGAWSATGIRDRLPTVSLGGQAFTAERYAEAVAAIHAGTDVNFEGVSGSVDFRPRGDTTTPYDIWAVRDGQIAILQRAIQAPP